MIVRHYFYKDGELKLFSNNGNQREVPPMNMLRAEVEKTKDFFKREVCVSIVDDNGVERFISPSGATLESPQPW